MLSTCVPKTPIRASCGLQAGPLDLAFSGWMTSGWDQEARPRTAPATRLLRVTSKALGLFECPLASDRGQRLAPQRLFSLSFISFREISLGKITDAQYITKIEEQPDLGCGG